MTDSLIPIEEGSLTPSQEAQQLVKLQVLEKDIKARIDASRLRLLKIMQDNDVLSLKTGEYTLFRTKRLTTTIVDQKQAIQCLKDMNVEVVTEVVLSDVMKLTYKGLIEQGKDIDGIATSNSEYVSVRVNNKK